MLSTRTLLHRDGLELSAVACSHRHGRGACEQHSGGYALVFIRRGRFVRAADGVASLLDPSVAYCMNPGEEQRYDHLDDAGDDCTSLFIDAEVLAGIWGGELGLPQGALQTSPAIDLAHRLLLRRAALSDQDELLEQALMLAAATLALSDPHRVHAGRPSTTRARRALADGARELLAADPQRSLGELAGALSVSPHHLSRVFREGTGHTISRHRMRLRVRAALERLADGERDLARLSAELGFADQSHLCRVMRDETGHTPAALRSILA
ncbi:MAG TPA: helix-turn-helix transcriptional regulator [Solirubrobacteraceae bacterium]